MEGLPPQGPLTVLFTDVERSTELYNVRGDDEASGVLHAHAEIVRAEVARHGGWEIKWLGDGFMLAFSSVRAAIACAAAIQRASERDGAGHPERAVRVRVGINSGEVTGRSGDLFGQAVNAAARILAAAEPGQILVSRVVKDLVGTLPGVAFVDRGPAALKGFADPWAIYEVDWRGAAAQEQLHVRLLGHPDVRIGTTPVEAFASHRLQSLLAYLIVHRQSRLSRQRVAFLFWPDSSESQARTNLRQAMHNLRHALDEPDRFLWLDGQTVQWLGDAPAEIDVVEFEAAAQRAEVSGQRGDLEKAATWYAGDLLPGCYDEWVEPERRRLRRLYVRVLDRLATLHEEAGDTDAAVSYAQQLLELEPLDEATYRRLMRLHSRSGDRARALLVYHSCVSALERELGVPPSPETVALYDRLMSDPTSATEPRITVPELATAPVIGRDREWAQLVESWHVVTGGRARCVWVRGEAGIGKSRLVEDFRAWCARQGAPTASGRAYEAEGSLSYAPIIDVLRSPAVRPGLARLDAVWLTEIARFLPELAAEHPDLPRAGGMGQGERMRLFEALARAIAPSRGPLVLVVDDLQWCDADTLEFLHFLVRFAPTASLLLLGTARDEDIGPDHPLRALVAGLRAIDALVEIPLGRLDEAAARALAEELVGHDEDTLRRVVEGSEGNRLFLMEIARSGLAASSPDDAGGPVALPARVQSVIEARLAKLPDRARDLASAAAVVGRAFTIELLSRLVPEHDEEDVVGAVDDLWRSGIVHERGLDAYDFTHDKIREVAYLRLGPARRRRLHLEVARALEDLHGDGLDAIAAQVAAHYDRAGSVDLAVQRYGRAVDVARHVFAYDDLLALARRGLELIARQPATPERDDRELGLLIPLGIAIHAGSGVIGPEALAVHERTTALRAERGLPADPSTVRLLANQAVGVRDFVEVQRRGEILLARATDADDPVLTTEAEYLLGVSAFWLGQFESSHVHLTRALAAYRPEQVVQHLEVFGQDPGAVCLIRKAFASWHLGRFEEVEPLVDAARDLARVSGHGYTRAYVELFIAWMALDAGDDDRVAVVVDGLGHEGRGHRWVDLMTTVFTGWSEVLRGALATGITSIEDAARVAHTTALLSEPFILLLLARARARAGDCAGAVEAADRARRIAQREMPMHESEASRLYGELLAEVGGEPAEIEAALRGATTTATAQGGVVLELRARTALVRWLRAGGAAGAPAEERRLEALRRRLSGSGLTDLTAAGDLVTGGR